MEHGSLTDPALTVAVALAAGMLAQAVARHARIPGIVVLLATGVVLGPDVLGLVLPDTLGESLHALVGFAVAVILFEGGMNLDLRRLRREARSIRQLVTVGALVTALGGTLAARELLHWSWTTSILFGTLVIVTGPTVVTPLLRRIRVRRKVATVLEAEGVLIDAVGAIVAVVALQVVLSPPGADSLARGLLQLVLRLGFGFAAGLVGGLLIAMLLRIEWMVPEGLENVFTLSLALGLFQVSNVFLPESGIVTVTVAGMAVGNVRTRALGDLKEFKEQLTVLLIGLLFVLLAADVRVDDVRHLGTAGIWTVVALILVVRPLNVLAGTWGSDLNAREKLFLCWLAPRGIVAAAVSSLFAESLHTAGIDGGPELRAMVFLVIAATVVVQGLTGGLVARVLDLRRPSDAGYAILGANDLGRALGRVLRDGGEEVVFIESNPDACHAAESEGFRVLHGSGLRDTLLQRAELDGRAGCIGLTPNDELNLLFVRRAREDFRVPRVWGALRRGHESVTPEMLHHAGARVLFGEPRHIDLWSLRLERGIAIEERWTLAGPASAWPGPESINIVLPLARRRGKRVAPVDEDTEPKKGDEIFLLIFDERRAEAERILRQAGWRPGTEGEGDAAGESE